MNTKVKQILEAVERGEMTSEEALLQLKAAPFEDLGYAEIDYHRSIRQGVPEVIYGASKTPAQICGILSSMKENGQENVLITRLSKEAAAKISKSHEITYYTDARLGCLGEMPEPDGIGKIVVATFPSPKKPPSRQSVSEMKSYVFMMWESPDFTGFLLIRKRS